MYFVIIDKSFLICYFFSECQPFEKLIIFNIVSGFQTVIAKLRILHAKLKDL